MYAYIYVELQQQCRPTTNNHHVKNIRLTFVGTLNRSDEEIRAQRRPQYITIYPYEYERMFNTYTVTVVLPIVLKLGVKLKL